MTMRMPPIPPPALVPPGIGMRIPPPPSPPPPPDDVPTSRVREVSSRALGLKRIVALLSGDLVRSPSGGTWPLQYPGRAAHTLASLMITAQHLEVRAGARLLMQDVSFRVA